VKHAKKSQDHVSSFSARLSGAVGLVFVMGFLVAASASATYEQVDTFATEGEDRQLVNTTGMAVNFSGAGGVPAGTVYAVAGNRVLRYSAKGQFREAWGWQVAEPSSVKDEFQRCGPDGEAAHPHCSIHGSASTGGEGVGQLSEPSGVAVDQSTGNVYVLNNAREHNLIQVFTADGSQLLTAYGDGGVVGETFDEGPEKIHGSNANGITVDSAGVVYVYDHKVATEATPEENRIMVFEPQSPGDYQHYVYAGRSRDIVNPQGSRLAIDSAGNLYVAGGAAIYEFSPAEPVAPVCEYQLPIGGIQAMTVNSQDGEVFYYSYKDKKIHQLAACNSQGEFVETTSSGTTPKTAGIVAMAFDPVLAYEASRPAGALYAADASEAEGRMGLGFIFAPAEVRSPSVDSESFSAAGFSSVTLRAQINPRGSETRYAFQYITDAAYQANEPSERFAGADEAPLGGASLGSGQVALSAAVALVGLAPDTEYRYRAIAASHCEPDDEMALCEDAGPAQVFRTFPVEAPRLPDNRVYELVSPPQKHGGEVIPAEPSTGSCDSECKPAAQAADRFPMQSAPDGEAVVYEGFPFSFTDGAARFNEYLSRRTSSGWQTTALSPALQSSGTQGYKAFNAELTRGLLYQVSPALTQDAPSEYANLYIQPSITPGELTPLLHSEPPNRLPGDSFKSTYAGASADFSRIFFEANDALTEATSFTPEAVDGGVSKSNLYEWIEGQLHLVNVLPGNTETMPGAFFGSGEQLDENQTADFSHTISMDGSRVFWSSEDGQVYVRENGESTRAIPDPGKFLTASADGSKVLLSNGHLYDLEAEATSDLSEGKGGFQGIIGQSEGLSSIYFVDTAVLTGGEENDQGAKAQAEQNNLYAWNEGASAFVATLISGDNEFEGRSGDWKASPSKRTAEASPGGRWVAFLSRAPLTGYDNTGPSCVHQGAHYVGGSCQEAFLYDSALGRLICVSCDPSGERPLGESHLRLINDAEGSLPQPRYLTDEGRLYFDSRDSLTPFDTNDGVEDVYQYEPKGIGSCKREGGCVSLISAGHEPIDSNFLAADESGKNVFFTSRDQLVLKDRDDLIDLYVAREGGGIAAETEAVKPPCQGEACVPALAPPNDPTPGSSTFEGAGNVDEKKAAKKKKHKKKRKHAKKHSHKRSHGRAANNNRGGAK